MIKLFKKIFSDKQSNLSDKNYINLYFNKDKSLFIKIFIKENLKCSDVFNSYSNLILKIINDNFNDNDNECFVNNIYAFVIINSKFTSNIIILKHNSNISQYIKVNNTSKNNLYFINISSINANYKFNIKNLNLIAKESYFQLVVSNDNNTNKQRKYFVEINNQLLYSENTIININRNVNKTLNKFKDINNNSSSSNNIINFTNNFSLNNTSNLYNNAKEVENINLSNINNNRYIQKANLIIDNNTESFNDNNVYNSNLKIYEKIKLLLDNYIQREGKIKEFVFKIKDYICKSMYIGNNSLVLLNKKTEEILYLSLNDIKYIRKINDLITAEKCLKADHRYNKYFSDYVNNNNTKNSDIKDKKKKFYSVFFKKYIFEIKMKDDESYYILINNIDDYNTWFNLILSHVLHIKDNEKILVINNIINNITYKIYKRCVMLLSESFNRTGFLSIYSQLEMDTSLKRIYSLISLKYMLAMDNLNVSNISIYFGRSSSQKKLIRKLTNELKTERQMLDYIKNFNSKIFPIIKIIFKYKYNVKTYKFEEAFYNLKSIINLLSDINETSKEGICLSYMYNNLLKKIKSKQDLKSIHSKKNTENDYKDKNISSISELGTNTNNDSCSYEYLSCLKDKNNAYFKSFDSNQNKNIKLDSINTQKLTEPESMSNSFKVFETNNRFRSFNLTLGTNNNKKNYVIKNNYNSNKDLKKVRCSNIFEIAKIKLKKYSMDLNNYPLSLNTLKVRKSLDNNLKSFNIEESIDNQNKLENLNLVNSKFKDVQNTKNLYINKSQTINNNKINNILDNVNTIRLSYNNICSNTNYKLENTDSNNNISSFINNKIINESIYNNINTNLLIKEESFEDDKCKLTNRDSLFINDKEINKQVNNNLSVDKAKNNYNSNNSDALFTNFNNRFSNKIKLKNKETYNKCNYDSSNRYNTSNNNKTSNNYMKKLTIYNNEVYYQRKLDKVNVINNELSNIYSLKLIKRSFTFDNLRCLGNINNEQLLLNDLNKFNIEILRKSNSFCCNNNVNIEDYTKNYKKIMNKKNSLHITFYNKLSPTNPKFNRNFKNQVNSKKNSCFINNYKRLSFNNKSNYSSEAYSTKKNKKISLKSNKIRNNFSIRFKASSFEKEEFYKSKLFNIINLISIIDFEKNYLEEKRFNLSKIKKEISVKNNKFIISSHENITGNKDITNSNNKLNDKLILDNHILINSNLNQTVEKDTVFNSNKQNSIYKTLNNKNEAINQREFNNLIKKYQNLLYINLKQSTLDWIIEYIINELNSYEGFKYFFTDKKMCSFLTKRILIDIDNEHRFFKLNKLNDPKDKLLVSLRLENN